MSKNTGLKIISVVMAVLLWFYVVNLGDITPRQNVVNANLRYANLEEGLSIILPDTVSVKIWGIVQETEEIIAFVDVKGLTKGTYQLPVKVEPVSGAIFTSVEPDMVEVEIKGEKEKSFPITHVVTRNPALGYELIDVMKTPDKCLLKGEENVVNQVNRVICEVDLSEVTGIKSINVPLKALDNAGQLITKGVRLVPDNINLYVVVNQNMVTKEVVVNPVVTGTPLEGHHFLNAKVMPEVVNVIIPALIADNLRELRTKPLDITGKSSSFRQEVEIVVPDEAKVYPDKVIIDVSISVGMENEGEQD